MQAQSVTEDTSQPEEMKEEENKNPFAPAGEDLKEVIYNMLEEEDSPTKRLQKRFTIFFKKQQFTKFGTKDTVFLKSKANGLPVRELKDFLITHVVGQGAFGRVYLAELEDESIEKYAIKSIRKDRLVDKGAIE